MESILAANGFRSIALQRQESFFMHHAAAAIAAIAGAAGPGLSPRKQTLMELLHPGNMGHKFQVLHARR
jgi:SAM-dependent MidA family methyltransferase